MNGNGQRRRLDVLEARLEPGADEEVQAAWRRAWDAAVDALLSTMAPEHVQGLGEEMQQREHLDPSRPYGRLWGEVWGRIGDRVGHAPGIPPRYPDAPLWLGPALGDIYIRGAPNLQNHARCASCGLRLPTAGELVPVLSDAADGSGQWHYQDTGEPCGAPGLPHVAPSARVNWRAILLLTACPLCGGSDIGPAWKQEGERSWQR